MICCDGTHQTNDCFSPGKSHENTANLDKRMSVAMVVVMETPVNFGYQPWGLCRPGALPTGLVQPRPNPWALIHEPIRFQNALSPFSLSYGRRTSFMGNHLNKFGPISQGSCGQFGIDLENQVLMKVSKKGEGDLTKGQMVPKVPKSVGMCEKWCIQSSPSQHSDPKGTSHGRGYCEVIITARVLRMRSKQCQVKRNCHRKESPHDINQFYHKSAAVVTQNYLLRPLAACADIAGMWECAIYRCMCSVCAMHSMETIRH